MITKELAIKNVEEHKKAYEEKVNSQIKSFCEKTVSPAIEKASKSGNMSCEVNCCLPYETKIKQYMEAQGFSVTFGTTTMKISWV